MLAEVPYTFRDDIEVVRASISLDTLCGSNLNGPIFKYASTRLRSNKKLVLEAVKNYGEAIEFVSPRFDDDKDVVITALKNRWVDDYPFGESIIYACISKRLRHDLDVMEAMGHAKEGTLKRFISLISGESKKQSERREVYWQQKYSSISEKRLKKWSEDCKRESAL